MSSRVETVAPADLSPGARQLSRGITATWWYTVTAVLFIELMLVGAWTGIAVAVDLRGGSILVVGLGGVLWCASTLMLLVDYRHRVDAGPGVAWGRSAVPFVVALGYGVTAGLLVGSWQLVAMPVVQFFVLQSWPRGVRVRVVIAATFVLVALAVVDSVTGLSFGLPWWVPVIYGVMLPGMSVSSLWWWDVLVTLDRARASEAKLAATQERLRVATDVHDLQGHHLQVIALQLELAERLLPTDAGAGMAQLRAARISVDEARQGTRDLATRFRSVPLGDELANARDLLTAAGLDVEAAIDAHADSAPASALGPVIRRRRRTSCATVAADARDSSSHGRPAPGATRSPTMRHPTRRPSAPAQGWTACGDVSRRRTVPSRCAATRTSSW
ncbi:histidine kinase dimerization/phosphoacceptor domain-containing protein [Microbacterium sp. Se5.02b]|uniref:histidine kinase dimerization/phosphoacceptor domain-containing protein n=1 Tax=Microbacterium sp. Se5.02b TaxID=2864103 RepID=UPI00215D84E5|nr:histidine kinase dimerization/phosphoacceptor domain-containing protein [Microbacterium sp. Se5.02b]